MKWLKWLSGIGASVLVILVGFVVWTQLTAGADLAHQWEIEPEPIAYPWPLTADEIAALQSDVAPTDAAAGADLTADAADPVTPAPKVEKLDPVAVARTRSLERGTALAVRLQCVDCHGADLSGRTVMDVPMVMGIITPNITPGEGGLSDDYTITDFDRIVRHGVKRDGSTSLMPAIDFEWLSDQEVSDLFAWLRSQPPVDRTMPLPYWGPVMKAMYATGRVPPPAAYRIDHSHDHPSLPPPKGISLELGNHLVRTCRSCHRDDYAGGTIPGGNPDWPPAANLTPHPDGLANWTREEFLEVMRSGRRPDGRMLDESAMPWRTVGQFDDVELDAVWLYLRDLEPIPSRP